jgi:hypothetical protein
MASNAPRVLGQILRERLSQLEHTSATAPLLSNEAQALLGQMVEEAMTEMLRRRVPSDAALTQSTLSISSNGEQSLSHYPPRIPMEQRPSIGSDSLLEDVSSDPVSGGTVQPPHSVASRHLNGSGELRNQHSNIAKIHPPEPKSTGIPKFHSTSVDSSRLPRTLNSSATVNIFPSGAFSDHLRPHQQADESSTTTTSVLYHPDQAHSLPATTGNCCPFHPDRQIMQAPYNHLTTAAPTSSDISYTSSGPSSTESLSLPTPLLTSLNNDVDCMPSVFSQETGFPISPDEVIASRRSIDSGYQSMLPQRQEEICFGNAQEDLTWLDQSLYEAIGDSWPPPPMTEMNVPANPRDGAV